jgi:hypothetical protein
VDQWVRLCFGPLPALDRHARTGQTNGILFLIAGANPKITSYQASAEEITRLLIASSG